MSSWAGITTSFSAPLGGLLLAVEEHSSFYNTNIFWRGFVATCTAVTVLHVLAQLRLHPCESHASLAGCDRSPHIPSKAPLPPPPLSPLPPPSEKMCKRRSFTPTMEHSTQGRHKAPISLTTSCKQVGQQVYGALLWEMQWRLLACLSRPIEQLCASSCLGFVMQTAILATRPALASCSITDHFQDTLRAISLKLLSSTPFRAPDRLQARLFELHIWMKLLELSQLASSCQHVAVD